MSSRLAFNAGDGRGGGSGGGVVLPEAVDLLAALGVQRISRPALAPTMSGDE